MRRKKTNDAKWLALIAASAAFLIAGGRRGEESPASEVVTPAATRRLATGDRPLLLYRFARVSKKPYVQALYAPSGANVLRDSPPDHVHHHGLMFGLAADGVESWADAPTSGMQVHEAFHPTDADSSGRSFQEKLRWTDAAGERTVLRELRSIRAETIQDPRATLVTWRSRLIAPAGIDSVELTGSRYYGLGMRFVESMDRGGRFFHAAERPGEVVRGDERLTASRWSAYTAPVEGNPVTVAIFDHPENPRHPALLFTMARPFAYLSATLNLWKEPLTVTASAPLDLCYGVAVLDGQAGREEVETAYETWLEAVSDTSSR